MAKIPVALGDFRLDFSSRAPLWIACALVAVALVPIFFREWREKFLALWAAAGAILVALAWSWTWTASGSALLNLNRVWPPPNSGSTENSLSAMAGHGGFAFVWWEETDAEPRHPERTKGLPPLSVFAQRYSGGRPPAEQYPWLGKNGGVRFEQWGFQLVCMSGSPRPTGMAIVHEWAIVAPGWFLALGLGVVLAACAGSFRRRRRLKRIEDGHCATCNYDLRAHSPGEKCPECGHPKPAFSPNPKLPIATETQGKPA